MTTQLAILTALSRVAPRLLSETAVRGDACAILGENVTITEARMNLHQLEELGHIAGVFNLDIGTRWKITDAGRLRLAEATQ